MSAPGRSYLNRRRAQSHGDLASAELHLTEAVEYAAKQILAAQLQQLTGANRNTLKMRLRTLVAAGHLKQNGQGKATWYSRHEIGPGGPEKK